MRALSLGSCICDCSETAAAWAAASAWAATFAIACGTAAACLGTCICDCVAVSHGLGRHRAIKSAQPAWWQTFCERIAC